MFIHNRIKALMMLLAVFTLSVTSNTFAMKFDKDEDKKRLKMDCYKSKSLRR